MQNIPEYIGNEWLEAKDESPLHFIEKTEIWKDGNPCHPNLVEITHNIYMTIIIIIHKKNWSSKVFQ